MSFWILKARPNRTDLGRVLRAGTRQRWRTRRPPKAWKPGDGVFLWQGAPALELRGVGRIAEISDPVDGECPFDIGYSIGPCEPGIGIDVLRADRRLAGASFLKAGAAGTVFAITDTQASALCDHIVRGGCDRRALYEWRGDVHSSEEPRIAISVRQPYAEMILRGTKTTEFRGRPTRRRGRVYLYAASKPGPEEVWQKEHIERGSLPTGVVIGTVDVMTCVQLSDGRYGYRLAHPRRIEPRAPERQPQPTWFYPFR